MKRLRKKLATLVHKEFKKNRAKRRLLFAEWVPVDVNDPNLVQYITDVMSTGGNVQIEYNGEWKTIAPYGWNSSKAGNVLLMCYKDTGEVRSYRLDRITNVQFDSDIMDTSMFAPQDGNEQPEETMVDGLEVPMLPEEEQFGEDQEPKEPESPFEDAIETLEEVSNEPSAEQNNETNNEQDINVDPNAIQEQNEIEDNNTFVPYEKNETVPA